MGFSNEFLTGLQERLQPGTSALILLVEHGSAVKLSESLAGDEGVMFQQTLTDEIVEELLEASEEEGGLRSLERRVQLCGRRSERYA